MLSDKKSGRQTCPKPVEMKIDRSVIFTTLGPAPDWSEQINYSDPPITYKLKNVKSRFDADEVVRSRSQTTNDARVSTQGTLSLMRLHQLVGGSHRDRSIHMERACHSMNAIMTQHGLLFKGFHISWLSWAHLFKQTIFCLDKWPNLGYADVKLNITCMHPLACVHTFSLCVYYNLYGRQYWSRV